MRTAPLSDELIDRRLESRILRADPGIRVAERRLQRVERVLLGAVKVLRRRRTAKELIVIIGVNAKNLLDEHTVADRPLGVRRRKRRPCDRRSLVENDALTRCAGRIHVRDIIRGDAFSILEGIEGASHHVEIVKGALRYETHALLLNNTLLLGGATKPRRR